jgi:hypothetical protein
MVISSILLLSKEVGSFTPFTSNTDCTPYNIFVSKGEGEYSAVIEWYTKEKCTGFVRYGKDMNKMENISLDSLGGNKGNFHEVVVDKLVSTERYYYLVVSGEQSYGSNGSPLYFTLEQL